MYVPILPTTAPTMAPDLFVSWEEEEEDETDLSDGLNALLDGV